MMNMTNSLKTAETNKEWFVVDATDIPLGRLSTLVASRLKGKHKPSYTPHIDNGDNIIIINAEKILLTGAKSHTHTYYWHTGYPGGIKQEIAKDTLAGKHPQRLVERCVKRMLPRTKQGRAQLKKLHVYAGESHPHDAQKPQNLKAEVRNGGQK